MPRITVNLTDDSYKIIQQYIEDHPTLVPNQFVKNAIGLYITMTSASKVFLESDPVTRDFFKGMKKIVNSKEYKQQVNQLVEKLSEKYSKEELKSLGYGFVKLEDNQKIIEKKNNPGPKPRPKRGPGRRVSEYEERSNT